MMIPNRNNGVYRSYFEPQQDKTKTNRVLSSPPRSAFNRDASRKKICVMFHPLVKVHPIIHINEYTEQEITTCWITNEEYNASNKQRSKEVKLLQQGIKLRDKKYCSRGIESCTRSGSFKKYMARQRAIGCVLTEQSIQNMNGIGDDDMLAHIYHCYTVKCSIDAHETGLRDREAVLAMLAREHYESSSSNNSRNSSCSGDESSLSSSSTTTTSRKR